MDVFYSVRFLNLIKPVMVVLPEVSTPDRKVTEEEGEREIV